MLLVTWPMSCPMAEKGKEEVLGTDVRVSGPPAGHPTHVKSFVLTPCSRERPPVELSAEPSAAPLADTPIAAAASGMCGSPNLPATFVSRDSLHNPQGNPLTAEVRTERAVQNFLFTHPPLAFQQNQRMRCSARQREGKHIVLDTVLDSQQAIHEAHLDIRARTS